MVRSAYDINTGKQFLREGATTVTGVVSRFPKPVFHDARQYRLYILWHNVAAIV
jgi:hypothetical protein